MPYGERVSREYVAAIDQGTTSSRCIVFDASGTIVGSLLAREAWVSIICAALLLVLVNMAAAIEAAQKRRLNIVIGVMLACALAIYFGVQPAMAALKEAAGGMSMRQSPQWTQFAILHGVSQLLYVVESVLAAVLVIRMR